MPGLCTFCDDPLDGSVEHIIPSCIGGRKTSTRVVCSAHNNAFGSSIDRALAEQFAVFCNLFAIRTGRNDEAPTLRDLTTSRGERIDLAPGGQLVAHAAVSEVERGPGERVVQVTASSLEQARRIMATYLQKYDRTFDPAEHTTVEESISQSAPVTFQHVIGGEEACRAFAKMALLLLASEYGTDVVRGPDTLAVRSFVARGGDASPFVRQDYRTEYAFPDDLLRLAEHSHRIAVDTSASSGVAVAWIELFGTFRFTVLLSDRWAGPTGAVFYGVDPVTGEHAETRSPPSSAPSAGEFRDLDSSDIDLSARIQRLFAMAEKRRMEVSLEGIVREVWGEVITPDGVGGPITAEDAARLTDGVTVRFLGAHFGRAYSKALDPVVALKPAETPAQSRKTGRRRKRKKR